MISELKQTYWAIKPVYSSVNNKLTLITKGQGVVFSLSGILAEKIKVIKPAIVPSIRSINND